jgi:hypothetical protein
MKEKNGFLGNIIYINTKNLERLLLNVVFLVNKNDDYYYLM